jgi:NAD(P)-dependent dehydrogenase (short-subunit alcohol dehydrogenase family)
MQLEGRTAIVTGEANGIGVAVVRRFITEGAQVRIVDIDEPSGSALAA